MSVFKIFPNADTTLYSSFPSKNAGLDEILEVSVKNSQKSSLSDDIRRSIVQFSDEDIQKLWDVLGQGDLDYDVYFRMYLANAENLSTNYTLEFYQVDTSWDMGTGKFVDNPEIRNGACWYNTGSYTVAVNNWPNSTYYNTPGGGSWSRAAVSQSFTYKDNKDINVNVTNMLYNWNFSNEKNAGILVKHTNTVERNSSSYKVLNFFSGDTHTIFPPCLEARWDDSIYTPGTREVIKSSQTVVNVSNNPYRIKYKGYNINDTLKYQFRVTARDAYPARQFTTSSIYVVNKALPSGSWWALQDVKTEDMIIDYDDNYTRISTDTSGSFFDVYMNGLEPERYYKLLIKYSLNSGEEVITDNDIIFKLVR